MAFHSVKIYYGPCKSFNDVTYMPMKLKGIRAALQKHGYRVDFETVQWRDYCVLEICGHKVFQCNVQNFQFNTCVERDPLAQRALQAVIEGSKQCILAKSFFWNCELLKHHLFKNNIFSPKDYFVPTFDTEPIYPYPCIFDIEDFKQKLNIKEYEKQAKRLETIVEERSDNDDSSDDDKLSSSLQAPPPSSNKEDAENIGMDGDSKVDMDDNKLDVDPNKSDDKGDVNGYYVHRYIFEYDNGVDDVDNSKY